MEDRARRSFRITPWRPWLLTLTLVAPLAAGGIALAVVMGNRTAAVVILLGVAGFAGAVLLPISLVARLSRWHVDPYGIGGRNNWLRYHHLAWSEITSVEPWLLPGYRYLQVNGVRTRWAFWLPLFLTDMPGLRAAVLHYAPPGNPLRHFLERHTT